MLPIDNDIIQKRKEIPQKIAQLTYHDEELAIHFMRIWGKREQPISVIHKHLSESLEGSYDNAQ